MAKREAPEAMGPPFPCRQRAEPSHSTQSLSSVVRNTACPRGPAAADVPAKKQMMAQVPMWETHGFPDSWPQPNTA